MAKRTKPKSKPASVSTAIFTAVDVLAEQYITAYGKAVLEDRSIPSIEDGMKPVQRRILWAMYNLGLKDSGTYMKSARIVGDVMGKYHPHGDCLHGSTRILALDGSRPTIREVYESGVDTLDVLSYDEAKKTLVPALAHSFRVGQVSRKMYKITLSTGEVIRCTANHPFMDVKMRWVKAEDMRVGTRLFSATLDTRKNYHTLYTKERTCALHKLVGPFVKKEKRGFVYHHINEDTFDNRPDNLRRVRRGDHARLHGDYAVGLSKGRSSMFNGSTPLRRSIAKKNAILMASYNRTLPIRKAFDAVDILKARGLRVNKANYENLRLEGVIYNLTKLSTLEKVGYSLGRIAEEKVFRMDTTAASGLTRGVHRTNTRYQKRERKYAYVDLAFHANWSRGTARVFRHLGRSIPLTEATWKDYKKSAMEIARNNHSKVQYTDVPKLKRRLHVKSPLELLKKVRPDVYLTVVRIDVIVKSEPITFYDFTVDDTHNMCIIPHGDSSVSGRDTVVVAHNSSIYSALVRLASGIADPLVNGYGNWGGHAFEAAAPRYTECKFSSLGYNILFNPFYIRAMETVPNYDGSTRDPVVLPSVYPLVLTIGQSGIAVGTTTNIPAFTFESVKKVTDYLLKAGKGNRVPQVTAKFLAKHLKFSSPYGGRVTSSRADIVSLMASGTGPITWECDYEVDAKNTMITMTGFPPEWSFENRTRKIAELPYVSEAVDQSDKDGVKFVIRLRKMAEEDRIDAINKLKGMLACSITYRVNVNTRRLARRTATSDIAGEDAVATKFSGVSIVQVFNDWLDWRLNHLEKRALYEERLLLQERLAKQELRMIAINGIDVIFSLLKKKNIDKVALLAKSLSITIEQSKEVWGIAVGQLDKLSMTDTQEAIKKIKVELKQVETDLKQLPASALRHAGNIK